MWLTLKILLSYNRATASCHAPLPRTFELNYLEWGQISQVKSIIPHKIPLTSDTSLKPQGFQVILTSDQLAINLGALTIPSGSRIP